MSEPTVWIVEGKYGRDGEWLPTVGSALSREDARMVLRKWRTRNPSDRYRLARYVRKEKP